MTEGPLAGVRVLEVGGVGPGPQAARQLNDLGAEVLRVEPPATAPPTASAHLHHGRPVATLDLRSRPGLDLLLDLADRADVLLECHRPGVAERLGFGPEVCRARNDGLIYTRLTGWGQTGPLADRAGHDINYIALSGALGLLGSPDQPPPPPLNLLGDFAGGAMFAVTGILAALVERGRSGHGQVLDVAMVDGVASFLAMFLTWQHEGGWTSQRGDNLVDGGAPFYACYRTRDRRYVAVGALEPKFYAELLGVLGLVGRTDLPDQYDKSAWPTLRALFAEVIGSRTRDEWVLASAGQDACLTPVLELHEIADDPHLSARGTYLPTEAGLTPAAAPRFDRTPLRERDTRVPEVRELARSWGLSEDHVELLAP